VTPFHRWVANTIQDLGGNPALYLCGLEQKLAPTYAVTRMPACQVVKADYFERDNVDSMRDFAVVTTNKSWLH
jgi:hypothetical protein